MRGRLVVEEGVINMGGLTPHLPRILAAPRIIIAACGTSWHAGLLGEPQAPITHRRAPATRAQPHTLAQARPAAPRLISADLGRSRLRAGEYLIESLARISVEVEYASEFRYRRPILHKEDVLIALSQVRTRRHPNTTSACPRVVHVVGVHAL